MLRTFWESVKQGIVWLGVCLGIVVGVFVLIDRFDLSRLEILVTLGFIGLGLVGYAQIKLLGKIDSLLRAKQKPSNNPGHGEHKPEPPEKPTGSGAVGGAVLGGIIGTILTPGLGTVIGGLLGALVGNKIEYDDIQRRKKPRR